LPLDVLLHFKFTLKQSLKMKKNLFLLFSFAFMVMLAACKNDAPSEGAEAGENPENSAMTSGEQAAGPGALTQLSAPDPSASPQAVPADGQPVAPPAGPTTTVSFPGGMEYDFGTIDAGKKVSHKYKLKNTGNEPLLISNCKASCGCTVPKCPTEPIAPGETAEIPVEYDSKGKNGPDQKTITITANTNPSPIVLTIKGNVKGQAPAPAQ
jgi:hypothetical protein